ncbi:opioid-binding protein/cell adhesion molecule homolog isoform X2 [Mercenaria mercenaria]|uniref:opioid-binding protein/cell adhesion molecule homolog isoform X2 n=1 Tax=Mercenaria mercenaria TaxID=6596 RepID=UPI00234FA0DB|nr:opioid-binding protein/cell adhesion molecule homolog isoform X2 [Mercenaria mercenaria]
MNTAFSKAEGPNPAIDALDANVTVIEGDTAILPCSVENLGEYKVAWLTHLSRLISVNGNLITDDPRFSLEQPNTGDWNLHIENTTYTDLGQYFCRVNTDPITSKTVNLAVLVPAAIKHELSSRNTFLREGETLVLICNVTGVPKPIVTWYKLNSGDKQKLNRSGEVLIIPNVTRLDGGTYECAAFNGVSVRKQISVSIEFAPKVTLLSKRIGQFVGRETILDCQIIANPQPDMYWLKGNSNLESLDKDKYQVELYSSNIDTSVKTLSLRLTDLQQDDFGEYTCYAKNSIGKGFDSVVVYDYAIHFTTTISPRATKTTTNLSEASSVQVSNKNSAGMFVEVSSGNNYGMTVLCALTFSWIVSNVV